MRHLLLIITIILATALLPILANMANANNDLPPEMVDEVVLAKVEEHENNDKAETMVSLSFDVEEFQTSCQLVVWQ